MVQDLNKSLQTDWNSMSLGGTHMQYLCYEEVCQRWNLKDEQVGQQYCIKLFFEGLLLSEQNNHF